MTIVITKSSNLKNLFNFFLKITKSLKVATDYKRRMMVN